MRTCALSHQNKGPPTVNFLMKPVLDNRVIFHTFNNKNQVVFNLKCTSSHCKPAASDLDLIGLRRSNISQRNSYDNL